mmetsp:Transcript_18799/g.33405  ORF Transcript_18799/g.33405 Transcript_18799/m.33405 type:complete len:223 (-) Transcript_18799:929-1597(-)
MLVRHGKGIALYTWFTASEPIIKRGLIIILALHLVIICLLQELFQAMLRPAVELEGFRKVLGKQSEVVSLVHTDASRPPMSNVDVNVHQRLSASSTAVLEEAGEGLRTKPPEALVVLPDGNAFALLLFLQPALVRLPHASHGALEVAGLCFWRCRASRRQKLGAKCAFAHLFPFLQCLDLFLKLRTLSGSKNGLVVEQVASRERRSLVSRCPTTRLAPRAAR